MYNLTSGITLFQTHKKKKKKKKTEQNTLSSIAHQMRRSQVLPGYPHSSAGAYGVCVKDLHMVIDRMSDIQFPAPP